MRQGYFGQLVVVRGRILTANPKTSSNLRRGAFTVINSVVVTQGRVGVATTLKLLGWTRADGVCIEFLQEESLAPECHLEKAGRPSCPRGTMDWKGARVFRTRDDFFLTLLWLSTKIMFMLWQFRVAREPLLCVYAAVNAESTCTRETKGRLSVPRSRCLVALCPCHNTAHHLGSGALPGAATRR